MKRSSLSACKVHKKDLYKSIVLAHAHAGIDPVTESHWNVIVDSAVSNEIYDILHKTWEIAPDHPVIHTWPKWHLLCDVLAE